MFTVAMYNHAVYQPAPVDQCLSLRIISMDLCTCDPTG